MTPDLVRRVAERLPKPYPTPGVVAYDDRRDRVAAVLSALSTDDLVTLLVERGVDLHEKRQTVDRWLVYCGSGKTVDLGPHYRTWLTTDPSEWAPVEEDAS